MNEQLLQMLMQMQQQGQFNIPTSTPQNSQMQGYTQNLWNQQPVIPPTQISQAEGISLDPNRDSAMVDNMSIFTNPEQLNRMQNNSDFNTATNNYDVNGNPINTAVQNNQMSFSNALNYAFAPVSTENAVFKLGQSLAFNQNNPYASDKVKGLNTARGIASGAKTLTSLLRTGFAGAAYQNKNNQAVSQFYNQSGQQQFNQLPQTFENGGTFQDTNYYSSILKNKKIIKYTLNNKGNYEVEYE